MPPRGRRGGARRGRSAASKSQKEASEETQEPELPLAASVEASIPDPDAPAGGFDPEPVENPPESDAPLEVDAKGEENAPEGDVPVQHAEALEDPEGDVGIEFQGGEALQEKVNTETENPGAGAWSGEENAPAFDSGDTAHGGDGGGDEHDYEGGATENDYGAGDCDYEAGSAGYAYEAGGAGNEYEAAGAGNEYEAAGARNEYEAGGARIEYEAGGAENEYEAGGAGNEYEAGGAGNEYEAGGAGNEYEAGGVGNNSEAGGAGNDFEAGGAGNDFEAGGAGNDFEAGGAGNDYELREGAVLTEVYEGKGYQIDQEQAAEKGTVEAETGAGEADDVEEGRADDTGFDEGGDKLDDDEKSASEGEEDDDEVIMAPMTERKRQKEFEIFVGGLDRDAVEEDLIKVFTQFGEIQGARIVKNPATQKSKGFGFIRYTTIEQAKKVLSDYPEGVEVRGRICGISASQDNDTLYLGNICKTWPKDQVLATLKGYGVEQIDDILFPEDPKGEGRSKGYAFLEFHTHSDAMTAFQRLRKPDAVFGCDRSARVAFAPSSMHPSEEALSQVKTVYVEGIPDSWDEPKVTEHCKQYGEIENVQLSKNFNTSKRRDFGFIAFVTRESAIACVEGINNAQLGEGEAKVKANLAKPQNKGRLAKLGARGGFRVKKDGDHGGEAGHSNTKGYVNFKGHDGKGKGHFKPKNDKWHKPSFGGGRGHQGYGGGGRGHQGYGGGRGYQGYGGGRGNQGYGGGRGNQGYGGGRGQGGGRGRGGGRGYGGGRGQGGGRGPPPQFRQKREDQFRGGKRGGGGMDNSRPTKKARGNMHGKPNNFGNQKNPRFGKPKPNYSTHPAAYGDPYAQAYGPPETSYQAQVYGAPSGSKRPYAEMDPHGVYADAAAKQVRVQYGYGQSVGGPGYDESQMRNAAAVGYQAAPAPPPQQVPPPAAPVPPQVSYVPDYTNSAGYEAAGYVYPPPPPNAEYAPGRPYY